VILRPNPWIASAAAVFLAGVALSSGLIGLLYIPVYAVAIAPGVLLGRRLIAPAAAGWFVGGVIGYGLVQLALWIPIFLGRPSRFTFACAWLLLTAVGVVIARRLQRPVLPLSAWSATDVRALALTLLLVPLVMTPPYRNLGAADEQGTRWYRAYFTADFVWHAALAAELGRYDTPPRNPYLASQDVHYYWTYFLLPSIVAQELPPFDDVQRVLKANAMMSALLLVGMFFLFVRTAVPGGGIAAAAVALGVLAASAEGALVLQQLWREGAPLAAVENMNIDAITNWQFGGLRVDNIPRSLWYTPQHAFACALGLAAAVTVASAGARASNGAIWLAGTALGLSTCFNPLLGGMFSLIYGLGVFADSLNQPRLIATLVRHAQAAVPVALALGWAALNEVAEGAGAAVVVGFRGFARNNTLTCLLLSAGPLLIPGLVGLWPFRGLPARPAWVAAIGTVLALLLMHFVTLSEASWVGFRAGQILLLMLPALLARPLWVLSRRRPWAAVALCVVILIGGLPTTGIDTYNAQDISNRRQGPGFHWTLPVTRAQQDAFAWVQSNLPEDATLQMEPMLRGREHWSLIPTFAQRRMMAGLPISLLPMAEYDTASAEVQRLFRTPNGREAWQLAHGRGIQYLYVDHEDRTAYPDGVAKFEPPYFERIFQNDGVEIYKVR
jgi:hypothetical protein